MATTGVSMKNHRAGKPTMSQLARYPFQGSCHNDSGKSARKNPTKRKHLLKSSNAGEKIYNTKKNGSTPAPPPPQKTRAVFRLGVHQNFVTISLSPVLPHPWSMPVVDKRRLVTTRPLGTGLKARWWG